MFHNHASLLVEPLITPWRPRVLAGDDWLARDLSGTFVWRMKQLEALRDPVKLKAAKAYYAQHPVEFVMHWMDTYDPRAPGLKWQPFILFEKQAEFFDFLMHCYLDKQSGLVEKARDMGATWVCCAFTVWAWLFVKDVAIGWGSRKQELVDRLGDASSIFEKLRQLTDRIPRCFMPRGFDRSKHAVFMKLINPELGGVVTGEVGDNIGRGGRTTIYFKDESAHYEHPEAIQAALDDNTDVQIDISSVNGLGNVFHRKRESGVEWPDRKPGYTRVFVFDYSDHPAKTPEWYKERRDKAEREGMLHKFAQEIDRNYSAAIQNTIIPMEWIIAARDAHLKIRGMRGGPRHGGLDIADEGGDTNALTDIDGVVLDHCEEWGARDPGVSARRAIAYFRPHKGSKVYYDNISYGSNVKSEINRLRIDEKITDLPEFIGWNAGAAVNAPYERVIQDDDESPLNKDFFGNFKAQAWWALRTRFLYTWQYVTQGIIRPPDKLISLNTRNPLIRKLEKELAQPTMTHNGKLQMIIDKKPEGTKSPNLADATVMGYFPPEDLSIPALVGR